MLPADWVAESTNPRYLSYPHIGHYARHWWSVPSEGASPGYYFALGYGGQFIIVVPDTTTVVAITSELYDQSLLPLQLFREYLLPVLSSSSTYTSAQ